MTYILTAIFMKILHNLTNLHQKLQQTILRKDPITHRANIANPTKAI